MKRSTKILLMVAGGFVALGVLLCGLMLVVTGGNLGVYLNSSGWHYGNEQRGSAEVITEQQEFSAITSIDVDVTIQEVELRAGGSGSTVKIEYSYPSSWAKPICTGEGGRLRFAFTEEEYKDNNFRLSFFNFGNMALLNDDRDYKVTITYPESMEFDSVKLKANIGSLAVNQLKVTGLLDIQLDLGSANLEKITSEDLTISNSLGATTLREVSAKSILLDNDLGSITCDNVDTDRFLSDNSSGSTTIKNSRLGDAELSANLGRILADQITTTRLEVENDNGSVELSGALAGKTEVDSDLGSVKINTNIARDQYKLDLQADLGSVYIDGEKMKSDVEFAGTVPNEIVVETNNGSININFK